MNAEVPFQVQGNHLPGIEIFFIFFMKLPAIYFVSHAQLSFKGHLLYCSYYDKRMGKALERQCSELVVMS